MRCTMYRPYVRYTFRKSKAFGRAVLHAAELNVPELGYVLPYTALQDALTHALQYTLSPGWNY